MTEIDLIPQDYRTRRWQSRWCKRFAVVIGSVLGLQLVAHAAINNRIETTRSSIATLQAQQSVSEQQRADIQDLLARQAESERQLDLLRGLRSGGAAQQLFLVVERALATDDVWFVDWRFQRSGVLVDDPEIAVNTGYFIVVPKDAQSGEPAPWQVRTHMTIRGQSRDHSALSAFVKGLFAQPEIEDVHLGRTTRSRDGADAVVDFDLAVVMNTNVRTP